MKRDFLALREEVSEEHRLRANTEEAMQFLKQQAGMYVTQVTSLSNIDFYLFDLISDIYVQR